MNRIRLRCYMRGLGIGIAVTTLIMGIAMAGRRNTMSDDEVRERARELGMVESTVLSQLQGQQKQENQENGTKPEDGSALEGGDVPDNDGGSEDKPVPEDGDTPGDGTDSENVGVPEGGDSQDDNSEPRDPGNSEMQEVGNVFQEESEVVLFTITRGESSAAVCQALEDAGLVEDAGAFDRYLCDNGYATRIVAETYRIPVNATEEEIIEMIIKK